MPCVGTNVEFTLTTPEHTLPMSSSGGELFGRLMTRKSHETLFILEDFHVILEPMTSPYPRCGGYSLPLRFLHLEVLLRSAA